MKLKHVVPGATVSMKVPTADNSYPYRPKLYSVRGVTSRNTVTLQDAEGFTVRRRSSRILPSHPGYASAPTMEFEPRELQPFDEAMETWATWHRQNVARSAVHAAALAYDRDAKAAIHAALAEKLPLLGIEKYELADLIRSGSARIVFEGVAALRMLAFLQRGGVIHDGIAPDDFDVLRCGSLRLVLTPTEVAEALEFSLPDAPDAIAIAAAASDQWTPEAQEAVESSRRNLISGL